MTWTATKPTQSGWYWYRRNVWQMIVYLDDTGYVYGFSQQTLHGEWAGPIPEPKEGA